MDRVYMSFGCLVIALFGLAFAQTTRGFKSEAAIMAEIKSMAAGIKKECVSEAVTGSCDYYKRFVDRATTIADTCSSLDRYISCQDRNCLYKTAALTQILTDAMVIPYCGEMASFPRTPDTEIILSKVADLRRSCILKDDHVCDVPESLFLSANSFRKVCLYEKFYLTCLMKNCLPQTTNFSQQIKDGLSKPDCGLVFTPSINGQKNEAQIMKDIKDLTFDLHMTCAYPLILDIVCDTENRTVWTSCTKEDACVAIKSYAKCTVDNCLYVSSYMNLTVEQVNTYQDCQTVNTPFVTSAAFSYVTRKTTRTPCITDTPYVTRKPVTNKPVTIPYDTDSGINSKPVSDLKKLCYLDIGTICDTQESIALAATETAEACLSLKNYATCLAENCLYIDNDLRKKITEAMTNPLCSGCDLLQLSILLVSLTTSLHFLLCFLGD